MLEIYDLHVNVEGKEILRGINLMIPDHETHVLFGPNGSGKSVLISAITGYPGYDITKGEILYNGELINEMEIDERVRLGISALEQRPPTIKGVQLGNLAGMINMLNDGGNNFNVTELAVRFGMSKFLDRDINYGFSGGEIKKSELFLLIIAKPSFIMLDEPDSGVDPEHLRVIGEMINEALSIGTLAGRRDQTGMTRSGLIATHSSAILDYIDADKAYVLLDGKIKCAGSPGIMMDQIREKGYEYCVRCQQTQ